MKHLLNRIRRAWKLSKTPSDEPILVVPEGMTADEVIHRLAEGQNVVDLDKPLGDGHAEFLEPMTDEEYATWIHENEHGWKKIYDKLLRRNG